jgi:hypothetical protein
MRILLIVIIILTVLFIVIQTYVFMATNKSETQTYKVIKVEKEFEIRFYPSVTMAMIKSSAVTYKDLGSSGFKKLAGYIFGGNKDNKQIAMTSPVHMDIGDSVSTMAFVMPSSFNKNNLPSPNDSNVTINTVPEEYVAAITFGGFASSDNIKEHTIMLENALKKSHVSYFGNFRFLGYNPPYQLFGRRNEIIVSVNLTDK